VVDNEQVIANILAIILNQAGFEARAAFSAEQAIELLESSNPKY
jgi:DNA-binding response OmpR family regulator